MRLRIVQKIIDAIRGKSLFLKYDALSETVRYLSQYIEFDKNLSKSILKKHRFPYFTFKNDKKKLKKYLSTIDATSFPKARGILREHQLKLLNLAKEVMPIMESAGVKPFIIGGTLLGAVRHGGFIPWDEDIDFDMMRDDYDKLWEYVKKNFPHIDNQSYHNYAEFYVDLDKLVKDNPNKVVFALKTNGLCAYRGTNLEDILTLDFFPRDYIKDGLSEEEYLKYRNECDKFFLPNQTWHDVFEIFNKEINNSNIYSKDGSITAKGWGSFGFYRKYRSLFLPKKDLFPLKRIRFEDAEFYAPNNAEVLLKKTFNNYNCIPTDIALGVHIKILNRYLKPQGRKYYIEIEDILGGKQ